MLLTGAENFIIMQTWREPTPFISENTLFPPILELTHAPLIKPLKNGEVFFCTFWLWIFKLHFSEKKAKSGKKQKSIDMGNGLRSVISKKKSFLMHFQMKKKIKINTVPANKAPTQKMTLAFFYSFICMQKQYEAAK